MTIAEEIKNQRQIREQEERYQRIIQMLSKNDYNPSQIEQLLENNPEETLEALCLATKQEKLKLENNPWKGVWKKVRQYYHKTNQRDMLAVVDKALYESTISEWRQYWQESFMNLKWVFASGLTIGYIPAAPQINAGLDKVYERYANKQLGTFS